MKDIFWLKVDTPRQNILLLVPTKYGIEGSKEGQGIKMVVVVQEGQECKIQAQAGSKKTGDKRKQTAGQMTTLFDAGMLA